VNDIFSFDVFFMNYSA